MCALAGSVSKLESTGTSELLVGASANDVKRTTVASGIVNNLLSLGMLESLQHWLMCAQVDRGPSLTQRHDRTLDADVRKTFATLTPWCREWHSSQLEGLWYVDI